MNNGNNGFMNDEFLNEESLRIRVFPDPVLKMQTVSVDKFDTELADFVEKMRIAMEAHDGVGLAAPQVGVSKKIALVARDDALYVLINPRLLEQSGEQDGEEGCLSFPGVYANVKRPERVKIVAQDLTGQERTYEVDGFLARAFLHEMDHLDGKLFIEYLSSLKRGMIRKKMYKRAAGDEG